MHELALCRGLRSLIEDQARQHDFARVRTVRVEIGAFACVTKEALAFAFDAAMRGSVAEGARLALIELPGLLRCPDCGAEAPGGDMFRPCPGCGGARLLPVGGDDLRLRDLEVE